MDFDSSWVVGENMNYIWDVITEQIKTSYYHIVWYQDIFKYRRKNMNKNNEKDALSIISNFQTKNSIKMNFQEVTNIQEASL